MNESNPPPGPVTENMSAAAAVRMGALHDRDQLWFGFLTRAAEGDRDAFAALYDATSSLVYSLVLRILNNPADAEEVTLDVYIQAWRDAKRFDANRGGVGAWLVTIARSRALDRIRSHESRQKREAPPLEYDIQSNVPSPEDLSAMSQDRRAVSAAMAGLSAEQREVIELTYFRGMSQSEMAEHLNLPLGTVKTRVRLAMIRLRELIGGWKA